MSCTVRLFVTADEMEIICSSILTRICPRVWSTAHKLAVFIFPHCHPGVSFITKTCKVAAIDAAGAVGSIKTSKGGVEQDVLVCANVTMTKSALKVDVCALPTDVAYNR